MWLTQCLYFLGLLQIHTKHWLPTIGTQRQRWSFGFTHLSEVKDLWHTGSWSIFRWQTGHNQCKLLLVKSINKKILFWRQKVGLFHVACSYYDILMTNTFCPVSCFESNENFSLCSNTLSSPPTPLSSVQSPGKREVTMLGHSGVPPPICLSIMLQMPLLHQLLANACFFLLLPPQSTHPQLAFHFSSGKVFWSNVSFFFRPFFERKKRWFWGMLEGCWWVF